MYPKEGWLGEYLNYTQTSEARSTYHFWVGAITIASTLQRNVCVRFGHITFWPNLYLLLLGPTGNRKSSAVAIGKDLLRQAGQVNILPEEISKQAILKELQRYTRKEGGKRYELQDATGLLIATELTDFLSKDNYKRGLVPFLTNLYDSPDDFGESKVTREGSILRNVCFNFLAASTPQWLTELAPSAVLTGGFMGRVVLAVVTSRRFIFMPPKRDEKVRSRLVQGLLDMAGWRGEVSLDDDAKRILKKHAEGLVTGETVLVTDLQAEGWYGRKEGHALKLCIVLAASQGVKVISGAIMDKALEILLEVEQNMMEAYAEIDVTLGHRKREKILAALLTIRGQKLARHQLWKKVQYHFETVEEFDKQLASLMYTKQVSVGEGVKGGSVVELVKEE